MEYVAEQEWRKKKYRIINRVAKSVRMRIFMGPDNNNKLRFSTPENRRA